MAKPLRSGVSLHGGPERSLCETEDEAWIVLETPIHYWTNDKSVGYLPRKAVYQVWNQPKKQKYVAVNKAEFGVCPAGFSSQVDPVFPHYALSLPLWNDVFGA